MSRQTFINTTDDMGWLRDVHLPGLPKKFKSAVILGNEDAPDRIEVYAKRDPLHTDAPVVFVYNDESDDYRQMGEQLSVKEGSWATKTWSKKSLTQTQRNDVLAAMRKEGVKPPKVGWCVKALGGEVCRHPPSKHIPGDTGYQVIEISVDQLVR